MLPANHTKQLIELDAASLPSKKKSVLMLGKINQMVLEVFMEQAKHHCQERYRRSSGQEPLRCDSLNELLAKHC
jgi:hypothetical protein